MLDGTESAPPRVQVHQDERRRARRRRWKLPAGRRRFQRDAGMFRRLVDLGQKK